MQSISSLSYSPNGDRIVASVINNFALLTLDASTGAVTAAGMTSLPTSGVQIGRDAAIIEPVNNWVITAFQTTATSTLTVQVLSSDY
jgi:hypothetical protein